jgi:hypothetical protein
MVYGSPASDRRAVARFTGVRGAPGQLMAAQRADSSPIPDTRRPARTAECALALLLGQAGLQAVGALSKTAL